MFEKIKEYSLPFLIGVMPIIAVFVPAKGLSLFLLLVVFIFFFERDKNNTLKKNKPFFIPYLVFVCFCVISTIISGDISVSVKSLERYISLILIPIIVFSSNLTEKRIYFLLKSFVLTMLIISIFSVFKLIWFVNEFGEWIEVMREANKNDTYVQFKYPHLMWDVHPSYWSYLMVIVNIILLSTKKFFTKRSAILLLIFFNINLFYLAARVPLFLNLWIHLIYLTIYFRKRVRSIIILYSLFGIVLFIAYFQLPFLRYKIKYVLTDDRFFLWPIVIENIKSNYFILGEGFGMAKEFALTNLKNIEDSRTDYTGTEIHNQYLTMLLETGVVGLFILIYVYIKPSIELIKGKVKIVSFPLFCISFMVVLASIIEPFFGVIKGIIIFAVFSTVFRLAHESKI